MNKKQEVITYQCPSCGHPVPVGSPVCPGCHRIFTQEDIGKYSAKIAETNAKVELEKHDKKMTGKVLIGLAIFLVLDMLFIFGMSAKGKNEIKTDTARLEKIYQEVEDAILAEDYDQAMLKALTIQPSTSIDDKEYKEQWNDRRETIINLIKEKQKNK